MSYLTQAHIANNGAMLDRLAQAAATEGFGEPDSWASNNRRVWASQPGWDAAWESAYASHPDDPGYDPGTDEAVITDGMILSAVQSIGEEPAP
jgi:hypothetical protein